MEDLRAALVQCTNVNKELGKDQKPFAPADFMPRFPEPTKPPADARTVWQGVQRVFEALRQCQDKSDNSP